MPRIFISYRRADSRPYVERIHDRLVTEFSKDNVFLDVETGSIPLGYDFRRVIVDSVNQCDVILVVIGPKWLDIREEDNSEIRRLDNPDDFVRIEVQTALSRTDALVIPVLVSGAQPNFKQLPLELKKLAYLNAKEIKENPYFHGDMTVVVEQIRARFPEVAEPKKTGRYVWVLAILAALLLVIGVVTLAANGIFSGLGNKFLPPTLTPLDSALQLARVDVTHNEDWQPFNWQDEHNVEMVLVPAGCFDMGSEDGNSNEKPVQQQCFDDPFFMDRTEVTRAMYAQCIDSGKCADALANEFSIGETQPINSVTWFQARNYCEWREARLPTESEWEFAARGPDNLNYPWGNEWDGTKVVWHGNSSHQIAPVGSRPQGQSWVGALDLSGNVWEWVSSLYRRYPYDLSSESSSDTDSPRILRGGSVDIRDNLRSATRNFDNPNNVNPSVGLRCVRS